MKTKSVVLFLFVLLASVPMMYQIAYPGAHEGGGLNFVVDPTAPGKELHGTLTLYYTDGASGAEDGDVAWLMRIRKGVDEVGNPMFWGFSGWIVGNWTSPEDLQLPLTQAVEGTVIPNLYGCTPGLPEDGGDCPTIALKEVSKVALASDLPLFITADFVIAAKKQCTGKKCSDD
jgi:hypothetical protein